MDKFGYRSLRTKISPQKGLEFAFEALSFQLKLSKYWTWIHIVRSGDCKTQGVIRW